MSKDPQRLASAYHEAGHVVVGRVVGHRPRYACCYPGGGGWVWNGSALDDESFAARFRLAVGRLAGPFAELRAGFEPLGRGDDMESVGFFFKPESKSKGFAAILDSAIMQAKALVREHWPAIRRVALELNDKGELYADDIERLTRKRRKRFLLLTR